VEAAPRPATADAGEALRLGVEAFRAGDFEAAKARFDEALRAEPSNFEATDWASKTQAELDKRRLYTSEMTSIRQAFAQHDYRGALYKLYRVEAPGSADRQKVNRWIADCWFDWGVESLQAGRLEDAEKSFKEARDARPDDREAAQHLQVLERYRGRPVDATLEAYAARLTLRPLE
jgi:Tfp pilus assembly protein PilF